MAADKKIVEHVSGWLRVFDDGTVDRTWTGRPEVEFLTIPVPPHEEFIDVVAVRDVTVHPNSNLAVRIYVPERDCRIPDKDKLPLILHLHGGGFCFSQADWYMYYHFYARLVRSVGAVCVSVFLRLAPEHRVPAACDDAYSAFLWLGSVARVHEVAARAGTTDTGPAVKLAGGIAIHPGFSREEPSKSFLELPESPMLTRDMVNKLMALGLPLGSTKDHPITCPMGPAAPPLDGLKLPPMLVAVAENDLLRDTELEYCEAMKKAGKDVEVLFEKGMGHCFYLNKIAIDVDPETAASVDRLIAAFTRFINNH